MAHRALLDYHAARATRELDMGLAAGSAAAARAHLQLASLHMARVRELTGTIATLVGGPPPT